MDVDVTRTSPKRTSKSGKTTAKKSSRTTRKKAVSEKQASASASAKAKAKASKPAATKAAKVDDNDAFEKAKAARSVEKSLDATQLYLNEIGYSPLLTADEEKFFARKARKGDESARKRMIESNLRLVVKISRRYINRGLTLLDLKDIGVQNLNLSNVAARQELRELVKEIDLPGVTVDF